jgi:hypothetical protein
VGVADVEGGEGDVLVVSARAPGSLLSSEVFWEQNEAWPRWVENGDPFLFLFFVLCTMARRWWEWIRCGLVITARRTNERD